MLKFKVVFVSSLILLASCASTNNKTKGKKISHTFKGCVFSPQIASLAKEGRELSNVSASEFNFYNNWQEAKSNFVDNYMGDIALAFGVNSFAIADRDSFMQPAYEKVDVIKDIVLKEYIALYPELSKKLENKKIYILISSKIIPTSFVILPPDKPKEGYIVINKEILNDDTNLYGTIAHEFAHLLLQIDSLDERKEIPQSFVYYKSEIDYSLPILEQIKMRDEKFQKKMERWSEYAAFGGYYSSSYINSVPFVSSFTSNSYLLSAYNVLVQNSCGDMYGLFMELDSVFKPLTKYNYGRFTYLESSIGGSDLHKIYKKLGKVKSEMRRCAGDFKMELLDIIFGKDTKSNEELVAIESKIRSGMVDTSILDFAKSEYATKPMVDAFFSISAKAQGLARAIEKEVDISKVKRFTEESHADEVGSKVLSKLGISVDTFFETLLEDDEVCKLSDGREPYSPLTSKHGTSCWRLWRAKQLNFSKK